MHADGVVMEAEGKAADAAAKTLLEGNLHAGEARGGLVTA
jgi:hypothetical protein